MPILLFWFIIFMLPILRGFAELFIESNYTNISDNVKLSIVYAEFFVKVTCSILAVLLVKATVND